MPLTVTRDVFGKLHKDMALFAVKALRQYFVLAFLLALPTLLIASQTTTTPRIWLWAWDRPEDLRFLNPNEAGVAFFVLGIRIREKAINLRPRTAPLRLVAGMHRIAVVRLDVVPRDISDALLSQVVEAIKGIAIVPDIEGIQLDFDALRSQRPFYRKLVDRLKRDGQIRVPITITALASWCMGDHWIGDLSVDGTVAMLFQMGPEAGETLAWLSKARPLHGAKEGALAWGLSTDQPLPLPPPSDAQVFLFHPHAWNRSAFQKALQLVRK